MRKLEADTVRDLNSRILDELMLRTARKVCWGFRKLVVLLISFVGFHFYAT